MTKFTVGLFLGMMIISAASEGVWYPRAYGPTTFAVSRDTGAVPEWSAAPEDTIGQGAPVTVDFCKGIEGVIDANWLVDALNRR